MFSCSCSAQEGAERGCKLKIGRVGRVFCCGSRELRSIYLLPLRLFCRKCRVRDGYVIHLYCLCEKYWSPIILVGFFAMTVSGPDVMYNL